MFLGFGGLPGQGFLVGVGTPVEEFFQVVGGFAGAEGDDDEGGLGQQCGAEAEDGGVDGAAFHGLQEGLVFGEEAEEEFPDGVPAPGVQEDDIEEGDADAQEGGGPDPLGGAPSPVEPSQDGAARACGEDASGEHLEELDVFALAVEEAEAEGEDGHQHHGEADEPEVGALGEALSVGWDDDVLDQDGAPGVEVAGVRGEHEEEHDGYQHALDAHGEDGGQAGGEGHLVGRGGDEIGGEVGGSLPGDFREGGRLGHGEASQGKHEGEEGHGNHAPGGEDAAHLGLVGGEGGDGVALISLPCAVARDASVDVDHDPPEVQVLDPRGVEGIDVALPRGLAGEDLMEGGLVQQDEDGDGHGDAHAVAEDGLDGVGDDVLDLPTGGGDEEGASQEEAHEQGEGADAAEGGGKPQEGDEEIGGHGGEDAIVDDAGEPADEAHEDAVPAAEPHLEILSHGEGPGLPETIGDVAGDAEDRQDEGGGVVPPGDRPARMVEDLGARHQGDEPVARQAVGGGQQIAAGGASRRQEVGDGAHVALGVEDGGGQEKEGDDQHSPVKNGHRAGESAWRL